ncbi:MAG: outer membrane protein assembly factor BamD [Zetaproteobacteria bacterium]|nr:outer membrane protein assembly factor BamD [Zetaproteobacteria bacterium]
MMTLLLFSCSTKNIPPSESAKLDYLKAKELIASNNFSRANLFLADFSAKHPYSQYTISAELLRIYAAYEGGEHILSETLATQFISNHPYHSQKDYAQYMLAMSHQKQTNPSTNDQEPTQKAIEAFEQLLKDFPQSEYALDAKKRLQHLYNQLAEHELIIGKFYFDHKEYIAAINHFQTVLENYQTTPSIEEALFLLATAYDNLGVHSCARDTAILLIHNYPNGNWSKQAAQFQ